MLEDAAFTLNSMTKKQSTITDFFQPLRLDSQLNVLNLSYIFFQELLRTFHPFKALKMGLKKISTFKDREKHLST